jgi:hypothetical protein
VWRRRHWLSIRGLHERRKLGEREPPGKSPCLEGESGDRPTIEAIAHRNIDQPEKVLFDPGGPGPPMDVASIEKATRLLVSGIYRISQGLPLGRHEPIDEVTFVTGNQFGSTA